jgi:hypothetical protein
VFGSHAVVVCILLTTATMWERNGNERAAKATYGFSNVSGLALLAILMLAPAQAFAQDDAPRAPRVRPERGIQHLVDEAGRRSPAIRESLDRLERLDVTVYIRGTLFARTDLEGRVALLSSTGSHRYLIIELACGRSELTQMATLGHELFHAIEIAEEPSVVSPATLADFYSRIGTLTGDSGGLRTFETEAAAAAGQRARRQLLTSTTRHGHGT